MLSPSAKRRRKPTTLKPEHQRRRDIYKRRRDELQQKKDKEAEELMKAYWEQSKAMSATQASGYDASTKILDSLTYLCSGMHGPGGTGARLQAPHIGGILIQDPLTFDSHTQQSPSYPQAGDSSTTASRYGFLGAQMPTTQAFETFQVVHDVDTTMMHQSANPILHGVANLSFREREGYLKRPSRYDLRVGKMPNRQVFEDPQTAPDQTTTYQQDLPHPAPPFMENEYSEYNISDFNHAGFGGFNQTIEPVVDEAGNVQPSAPHPLATV
jgi:hypothetical protein